MLKCAAGISSFSPDQGPRQGPVLISILHSNEGGAEVLPRPPVPIKNSTPALRAPGSAPPTTLRRNRNRRRLGRGKDAKQRGMQGGLEEETILRKQRRSPPLTSQRVCRPHGRCPRRGQRPLEGQLCCHSRGSVPRPLACWQNPQDRICSYPVLHL